MIRGISWIRPWGSAEQCRGSSPYPSPSKLNRGGRLGSNPQDPSGCYKKATFSSPVSAQMIFSILTVAILILSIHAYTVPTVKVSPTTLVINDNAGYNTVAVSMTGNPYSPVTYYWNSTSLLYSSCEITFSPQNWRIPQTFKIATYPLFDGNPAGTTTLASINSQIVSNVYPIDVALSVNRVGVSGFQSFTAGDP